MKNSLYKNETKWGGEWVKSGVYPYSVDLSPNGRRVSTGLSEIFTDKNGFSIGFL